jgi:hypothetical protein
VGSIVRCLPNRVLAPTAHQPLLHPALVYARTLLTSSDKTCNSFRYTVLYCPSAVWERGKLLEAYEFDGRRGEGGEGHPSRHGAKSSQAIVMQDNFVTTPPPPEMMSEHDARLAAAAAGAAMMRQRALTGLPSGPQFHPPTQAFRPHDPSPSPPQPPGLPPSMPLQYYQAAAPNSRLDNDRHFSPPPPVWPQAPYASPYESGGAKMYYDPVPWPGQQAAQLQQRDLHSPGSGWIRGASERTSSVRALGPNPGWGRAPTPPTPPPRAFAYNAYGEQSGTGRRHDLTGREGSPQRSFRGVGDHYNPAYVASEEW